MSSLSSIRLAMRKRSNRALVALALALFFGAAVGARLERAGAQAGAAAAARTETEAEAYRLYTEEQLITARTKAEEALEENPDSLIGHFVLGAVLHEAEGSLARSMFHFGRARELYETTWVASTRPDGAPWELHREILFHIQALAGEMELYDYQLQILGYHDYLYDPDLLAEQAWPLMQLGRYDEARDFAMRATRVRNDEWQKSAGLNALCAIEGEAGTREPWLEACRNALDNAKRRREAGEEDVALAVHAYNAAEAARATLDFGAAEALLMEGTHRLEFTPANPWRILALQYLDQGRMTDAAASLREMQRWRRRQPAYLRDQDRAETDVVFATVLLVAGESETGLRAVDRAIDQPDRRGLTSSTGEQALGAHALLRRALRRTYAEVEREKASFDGFFGQVRGFAESRVEGTNAWPDEERIRSVSSDDRRLIQTFRMYVHGGLEPVPTWLLGDLVEVLGPGVAGVAIREARSHDGASSPLAPYYDALEAEVALARGDEARAYNLAKSALERLPTEEQLLRARVDVIASRAAGDRGQHREALSLLEDALAIDGGVIRRMGLSIPARVRVTGGGAIATRAGEMIARSPRIDDDAGFEIAIAARGEAIEACLLSSLGAQIRCASVVPSAIEEQNEEARTAWEERRAARASGRPAEGTEGAETAEGAADEAEEDEEEPPEPVDPAAKLAEELHAVVFGAALRLSSADLSSLDGRTTTGSEVAREQMQNLLDQAMNPPP
jgi:tetratricopeptide (TPR) repeat protein